MSTLGLAIGAIAGIFSVVDTVLLDPLPYPHADRLVVIAGTAPGSDLPDEFGVAAEFFVQYKEQSRPARGLAIFNSFTSTLRAGDRVERIRMSMPTTLAVRPRSASKPLLRTPADAGGRGPRRGDQPRAVDVAGSAATRRVIGRTYHIVRRAAARSSA